MHTALAFPVLGEDVLVNGGRPHRLHGRSRIVRHAGARHVVATAQPLPARPRVRTGATLVYSPAEWELGDVQRELGMTEGFDVMLETATDALRSGVANMAHGGRIVILGILNRAVEL